MASRAREREREKKKEKKNIDEQNNSHLDGTPKLEALCGKVPRLQQLKAVALQVQRPHAIFVERDEIDHLIPHKGISEPHWKHVSGAAQALNFDMCDAVQC